MKRIALPITLGYDRDEVAARLEAERNEIEHMPLPRSGPITSSWVATELRALRCEIREVSS